ncbi:MAG: phosphopantothenoylcysteine decarboxylase [Gemmataceae bacterium]
MRFLVTAGNTQTPIDRVRCITNVFTGRTGTGIALEARRRGHAVCLLTSHPELIRELGPDAELEVRPYRTFDDLHRLLADALPGGHFDVLVHSAAVSDFALGGVYVPATGTDFDPLGHVWRAVEDSPRLADATAEKIKSHHDELWLRLVRTPKLADSVRSEWGFAGVFVKFKLEVGVSPEELLEVAERSRQQSGADFIVANTLEGMGEVAYIGSRTGPWREVPRADLAAAVVTSIEDATVPLG